MAELISSFDDVLEAELQELRLRREKVLDTIEPAPADGDTAGQQALAFRALGMAISGGGIRSATLNLGILQGLARRGLLPYVDYLSTVSGGGYIGSWLHGVVLRKCGGDPRKLVPPPDSDATATPSPILRRTPGPADEDPVTYLRNYSNYLAPRRGFWGTDSWLILSIWLRNMLLNQLILIPFLASLVAIAVLVACFVRRTPPGVVGGTIVSLLAFALLAVAVVNSGRSLRAIAASQFRARDDERPLPSPGSAWPTVTGVLTSAILIFCLHWTPREMLLSWLPAWLVFLVSTWVLHLTLQLAGGFLDCFNRQHRNPLYGKLHAVWMPLVAAAVTAAGLCGAASLIGGSQSAWHAVVWGPPLIVVVLLWGVSFHIGLMGVDFPDASREWLARVGAVLSIYMVIWLLLLGISVYGPLGLAWLALNYGGVAVAAVVAWAASTFFGVRAGDSASTGGASDEPQPAASSGIQETVAGFAPMIFVIGLVILIATAVHATLGVMTGAHAPVARSGQAVASPAATPPAPPAATLSVSLVTEADRQAEKYGRWFRPLASFVNDYHAVLEDPHTSQCAGIVLLIVGATALFLPLRININEFSMHHFYKNRLVRCYMGAGNAQRTPNPFTGFDPRDDIPIGGLHPLAKEPYYGPYPIVNTALNLSAGSELSKQERQAASFVFTPLYCGFDPAPSGRDREDSRLDANGYYTTAGYMSPSGPAIGTAMAISGAAANPNDGYHTSPAVAFLLTVFNVRLGWWVGNPRVKCAGRSPGLCPPRRPGPPYGLMWLIWELLGQTNGRSSYVNLSDGGHFDNLGLYELVRRRCRYIIVGDGEQDEKLTFESLGGAIRKCRADFGVEIDIDVEQIRAGDDARRTHAAVGRITYPDIEPHTGRRARGWLLYLKASLTGDEPEDVKQYHSSHPDFPHQTTLNQFFTESQFESYRRLGLHIADSVFENAPLAPHENLEDLFQFLAALWHAPAPVAEGTATKLADDFSRLVRRLSEDTDLAFLDREIVVGDSFRPGAVPTDPVKLRTATFFVLELIQLMENVWFEFHLEAESNRDNPKNGGWMSTFRQWARSPFISGVWTRVSGNYNRLFVAFVDELAKREA